MRIIADLHLHSKFSRATSREMDVETLAKWCGLKGINVVGTGDFTHPVWLRELRAKLRPNGRGLFTFDAQHFLLSSEVSNIYPQGGRLRKIHNIIFAPSFEVVDRVNAVLGRFGSLMADGRPTLSLPSDKLVEYVMEVSPDCMVVPAHVWTPWFSLYGSNSGFDALSECFGDQVRHIHAVETGLSSDPPMNWRIGELDRVMLISNSDAHSPAKLGREANVFECELDYGEILGILRRRDRSRFLSTIEFFPEEGKYHFDGHRLCNQRLSPRETLAVRGRCPTCGKPLTVGVMSRVQALATRDEGAAAGERVPFRHLIPLEEIIAEAIGGQPGGAAVREEYLKLVAALGPEFAILMEVPLEQVARQSRPRIVDALRRVRDGRVQIRPGYDGVFGEIKIFGAEAASAVEERQQLPVQGSLF
jgi:uncharacterized protein (TIGR00375 family)